MTRDANLPEGSYTVELRAGAMTREPGARAKDAPEAALIRQKLGRIVANLPEGSYTVELRGAEFTVRSLDGEGEVRLRLRMLDAAGEPRTPGGGSSRPEQSS